MTKRKTPTILENLKPVYILIPRAFNITSIFSLFYQIISRGSSIAGLNFDETVSLYLFLFYYFAH